MDRKKLIFVNRFFYPDHSATSQILTDLASDLSVEGFDVRIITSRLIYDDTTQLLPAAGHLGSVQIHRVWSSCFGRSSVFGRLADYATFYISASLSVLRQADRKSIVIIKTDPPLLSVVCAPLAKLRGAPVINWLQDVFPEVPAALGVRFINGRVLEILKQFRNASLKIATMNVVLGLRMRALFVENAIPPEKIKIIPNFSDGTQIRPSDPEASRFRSEWGLSGKFVVGYSGNLGRAHEFATILAAAQHLKEQKRIVFLFIGGGALRDNLEREVASLGLKNIIFKPYQPRELLSESLAVPDLHLVSLNPDLEGLIVPSKFYGIAAAGRPTVFIGSPDGEIAQTLDRLDCGSSVRPGDSEDLARHIERLSASPSRVCELGRNARLGFEREYDRVVILREWKSVLEAVNRHQLT